MSTSAERVARGAAYMDDHYPGWERKVDVAILDISDGDKCICGQVYGFLEIYDDWRTNYPDRDMEEYGFSDRSDGDAWVSLIKTRFDTGALSDMPQPRERSVPCSRCRRDTWEVSAVCTDCQEESA